MATNPHRRGVRVLDAHASNKHASNRRPATRNTRMPERVGDIRFTEWTREGRLQHPVWRGLRPREKAGPGRASIRTTQQRFGRPGRQGELGHARHLVGQRAGSATCRADAPQDRPRPPGLRPSSEGLRPLRSC
ncbi:hypothetical protein [Phycicoccus sp. Root101]|uniref:hypothetical protein n=1 Tax=Phycicoccus sp. Root101 TaxID=1736421 RepID=UPI00350EE6D3